MAETEKNPRVIEPRVRDDATAAHRGEIKAVPENVKDSAAQGGKDAHAVTTEDGNNDPKDSRKRSRSRQRTRSRSRTPIRRNRRSRSRGRSSTRSTPQDRRERSRSRSGRRHWRDSNDHRRRSESRDRRYRSRTRSPERHEERYGHYDDQVYDDQVYDDHYDDAYYQENHEQDRRRSRSTSVLSGLSNMEDPEDDEDVVPADNSRDRSTSEDNKENDEKDAREKKRKSPPPASPDKVTPKRKRFCAQSEEEKSARSLKSKDAKYINKALGTYMSGKTADDSILKTNPVPKNIDAPEELDDTWETRLERRHKDTILMDNDLKKVQKNLRNVFGPLTKLWDKVDGAAVSDQKEKDEMLTFVEQTILLLGKVNNDVTYTRRTRILNKFTRDKKKTTKTLKKYEEYLEDTDGALFGKSFEKKLKRKGKAKKTQHEVFMALNPDNHRDRPRGPGRRQPFQDGPTHENRDRGVGARNNRDRNQDRDSGSGYQHRGSFRGRSSGRRPRRGGRN